MRITVMSCVRRVNYFAEGALSIVAPENIVENKDVRVTKIVMFAIVKRALTEVRQLRCNNHALETLLPTTN